VGSVNRRISVQAHLDININPIRKIIKAERAGGVA
jgi:hypothetical protein